MTDQPLQAHNDIPGLADPSTEHTGDLSPKANGRYERLRARIARWASRKSALASKSMEAALILPDFFRLLCGLAADPDVPPKAKAKITLALLYIVSPIDLLPEALFGPVSYLDDLVVAVYVVNHLLNQTSEEVIARHWKGKGEVIKIIRHYVAVTDELAGSGLLRRVRGFLAE